MPVVALGVGTCIGMIRPPSGVAVASEANDTAWASRPARSSSGPPAPAIVAAPAGARATPVESNPQTIDSSKIPDPHLPLPDLNPEDEADRAWLLAEGPFHRPRDGRRLVTFTFDDGPSPETASTLLRLLDEHRIRAAFFFIGEYLVGDSRRAVESREWARRIAAAGHYVGNHTYDHRRLTALSHTAALAEIDDAASAIERATGARPWLFRPPYGALDPWLERALRDRSLDLLLWNIDVDDVRRTDPDATARCIEDQLNYKQGGIVLLHDMHWPSVRAFNRLLRRLEAHKWQPDRPDQKGWDIVDLTEYLQATADSPQPYGSNDELQRARRAMALQARAPEL